MAICDALRRSLPPLDVNALRTQSAVTYSHAPLNKDIRSFRLAFLYPGLPMDPLRCSFAELPFGAVPDYWALSYTWGEPTIVSEVWIGNRPLGITKNLKCAMMNLRHTRFFRPVWVDALCINQTDDDEKNGQIPLMRDIYETATKVVIYLGEDEDDSVHIPKTCRKILRATADFWSQDGSEPLNAQQAIIPRSGSSYESLGLPHVNSPIWEAFRKFLSRPWFRRVWIIQEAVVSKNAEVTCGKWKMSWTLFINSFLRAMRSDLPILGGDDLGRASTGRMLLFMKVLGAGEVQSTRWKLLDLLHRCRVSNATNPRDYVFGLLGLSIEADEPMLTPNYSESVHEVYHRYAVYFIEHGDGIAVLYNSCSTMPGLPSWVPDWSDRHLPQPRLCPEPHRNRLTQPAFSAASAFQSSIRLHPSLKDKLIVKGVRVDTVESLGALHTLAGICLDEETLRHHGSRNYNSDLENEKTMRLTTKCVIEARHMLNERFSAGKEKYPTLEDIYTVIWRLLICNLANRSLLAASPEYVKFYRAFEIAASGDTSANAEPFSIPELTPTEKLELITGGSNMAHNCLVFMQGASEFSVTRRRCLSLRNGYIGQVPLNTRVGDEIFLPLGSAIPFIVRPRAGSVGNFELIGECYVHGIMNGEVFKSGYYQCEEAIIV